MNLKRLKSRPSIIEDERKVTLTALDPSLKIVLLPIDELKPHERGSPVYLELIKQEILRDGLIKYPVISDEKTHVILDGTHRWLALKSMGYTLIPVILIDLLQNPKIHVGRRRIHRYTGNSESGITVGMVISAGLNRRLMKPRSTRHFFPFSKFQPLNYPLRLLRKRAPQDVSRYLARMTEKECNRAIRGWLEEISEEMEFLTKRREEVEREMEEFSNRIKSLHDA
jgi:hypothetical protein